LTSQSSESVWKDPDSRSRYLQAAETDTKVKTFVTLKPRGLQPLTEGEDALTRHWSASMNLLRRQTSRLSPLTSEKRPVLWPDVRRRPISFQLRKLSSLRTAQPKHSTISAKPSRLSARKERSLVRCGQCEHPPDVRHLHHQALLPLLQIQQLERHAGVTPLKRPVIEFTLV
jgi:hypothetical protein